MLTVRWAISSKSCALITVSRSGFSWSWSSVVFLGGGLDHSSVIVRLSTEPLKFDFSRLDGKTEGAWMELYDVDASLPACCQITGALLDGGEWLGM